MLHLSNDQRILGMAILFLFLAWFFESFFLTKYSAKVKRGFKIWSKPLSSRGQEYLSRLTKYIIEPRRVKFQLFYSFIIVEDKEAVICPIDRLFFPCIGYVDLAKPDARLEYRGGVTHFLVFLLAIVYGYYLVIPIFAFILIVNYWLEIWMIDVYLNNKIARHIHN